jgi:hypothetical protein
VEAINVIMATAGVSVHGLAYVPGIANFGTRHGGEHDGWEAAVEEE